jgi:hypothetical protein
MADSGGHWKTLAEAQKLTQATRVPGVIEEDIKRNNPIDRIPVAQAARSGYRIEWLREKTTTEAAVNEVDIGEALTWTDDVEYTEVSTELKRVYIQRKMDHFVESIYGNINDYKARKLLECEKGLKRKLGTRLIYADLTYSAGNKHLRLMVDSMKAGVDEILAPYEIIRRMDAAYQEKGFASFVGPSFIAMGYNELGKRVLFWDAIPISRTDYLLPEQANSGTGSSSDARALHTSGDAQYSIFLVKYGSVMDQEPGICFAYGGTEGAGDLYKLVMFDNLEDYDAGGIRLLTYGAVLKGSTMALARMFDIEDSAIVV